jgi:hypothetical protein
MDEVSLVTGRRDGRRAMGMFDTVTCEYPLPNTAHQELEFQTKDLECLLDHYTITKAGRLLRRFGALGELTGETIEWPYHGKLTIYTGDPEPDSVLIEYVVYLSFGLVAVVLPAGQELGEEVPLDLDESLQVTLRGRALTADELHTHAPEKLELVNGRITGGERLLLLLVGQLGWDRTVGIIRSFVHKCRGVESKKLDGEERTSDRLAAERALLRNLKAHRPQLEALLGANSGHWGFEDPIYRFYHQSFKVYGLQDQTLQIVEALQELAPECELNPWFREIVGGGTGKVFHPEHNADWANVTRPIVEAFHHARFFLEMAARYAHIEEPPSPMPSGYAVLLALYGLR